MQMFSKIKYRHKVAAVIFLFILLPFLVLSTFIATKSWDEKVEGILEQNKSELKIGVEALNTLFLSSLQKLAFINNNRMISAYLYKGEFNDFVNNMSVYYDLKRTIDVLVIDSTDIRFTIYPVDKAAYNGSYIENMGKLEKRLGTDKSGFMQQLLQLEWDENVWRYEEEEKPKNPNNTNNSLGYVCFYKKMQLIDKTLAITEMKVKVSKVLGYINGVFPEGSSIVYKPDDDKDFFIMKNIDNNIDDKNWNISSDISKLSEGKYYPIKMKLNNSSGTFTLFIPRSYIMSTLWGFLLIQIVIVAFSILILFLIVELASYLITRRLSRLIDTVSVDIENTNMSAVLYGHSSGDDLGRMEDKFYGMLDKISENYKKILEYENGKKTFELELLQSRINPHFLYNTLSTMKWNSKNEKMANIIDSMVLYYRLALNKGDTIVKISQELKLVEEYMKIQKYTYESDFMYTIEVDNEVNELLTIQHLLQPIVENAVLHGINGLESGGMIKITGKLTEGFITLMVSDNGVGMTQETVDRLIEGVYESKIGGYGINNVQKRINLFYGQDSTLSITSSPGKGTTAIITIPESFSH